MRTHLLLFLLCAVLGVPLGAASVAYALSCQEPAVRADLEPVAVTVDSEPVAEPLDVAPTGLSFSRSESGRGALTTSGGTYIDLPEAP